MRIWELDKLCKRHSFVVYGSIVVAYLLFALHANVGNCGLAIQAAEGGLHLLEHDAPKQFYSLCICSWIFYGVETHREGTCRLPSERPSYCKTAQMSSGKEGHRTLLDKNTSFDQTLSLVQIEASLTKAYDQPLAPCSSNCLLDIANGVRLRLHRADVERSVRTEPAQKNRARIRLFQVVNRLYYGTHRLY